MTDEEQRVIDCARRQVSAGREYMAARVILSGVRSLELKKHLSVILAEHRAAAENAEAELALMDAVDAFDAVEAGR